MPKSREELSKTKATYQALCNLEAQHEGYGRAVKSLFRAYDGKKKACLSGKRSNKGA